MQFGLAPHLSERSESGAILRTGFMLHAWTNPQAGDTMPFPEIAILQREFSTARPYAT